MSKLLVDTLRHTGASADSLTLDSGGGVTVPTGKFACPGTIIQVAACPKTDYATHTTDDTWNDITGVDQAGSGSVWCCKITPTATSSKILMLWDISIQMKDNSNVYHGVRIVRDSTAIHQGAATHANTARATAEGMAGTGKGHSLSGTFLDSPSSTSELTYKIQTYHHNYAVSINQGGTTSNNDYDISQTSNITLLEVAG